MIIKQCVYGFIVPPMQVILVRDMNLLGKNPKNDILSGKGYYRAWCTFEYSKFNVIVNCDRNVIRFREFSNKILAKTGSKHIGKAQKLDKNTDVP